MSDKIKLDYDRLSHCWAKLRNLNDKVRSLKSGSVSKDMFINSKGAAADSLNALKDNLIKSTDAMIELINRTDKFAVYTSKQFKQAEADKASMYNKK